MDLNQKRDRRAVIGPEEERIFSCFVCGKNISVTLAVSPEHWPATSEGLVCHAAGNYGSALFDPDGCEFLEFVICDHCFAA